MITEYDIKTIERAIKELDLPGSEKLFLRKMLEPVKDRIREPLLKYMPRSYIEEALRIHYAWHQSPTLSRTNHCCPK